MKELMTLNKFIRRITLVESGKVSGNGTTPDAYRGYLVRVPEGLAGFRMRLFLDADFGGQREASLNAARICVDALLPDESASSLVEDGTPPPQERPPVLRPAAQELSTLAQQPHAEQPPEEKIGYKRRRKIPEISKAEVEARAKAENWPTQNIGVDKHICRGLHGGVWCYTVSVPGRRGTARGLRTCISIHTYGFELSLEMAKAARDDFARRIREQIQVKTAKALNHLGPVTISEELNKIPIGVVTGRKRIAKNSDLPSHMGRTWYQGQRCFYVARTINKVQFLERFVYDGCPGSEEQARQKALKYRAELLALSAEYVAT